MTRVIAARIKGAKSAAIAQARLNRTQPDELPNPENPTHPRLKG